VTTVSEGLQAATASISIYLEAAPLALKRQDHVIVLSGLLGEGASIPGIEMPGFTLWTLRVLSNRSVTNRRFDRNSYGVTEDNWRDATARSPHFAISESPAFVGRAVAALAQDPNVSRWNGQSLSSGQLAKIYGFTDLDGSQPDAWRYVTEVQDAGKPADVTGYR
jgi:hypothetical protein